MPRRSNSSWKSLFYLEEEIVVAAVEDDRQVAIPELRDEVDGRSLFPGFGMPP